MTPHPIIVPSIERRENSGVVLVEEVVWQESIVRSIELDQLTFEGLERVFNTHPFPKKRPENDLVLFRGVETPLGTEQKYLNLQIVNRGSRRYLKVDASLQAHSAMKHVLDSWCKRFESTRGSIPDRGR